MTGTGGAPGRRVRLPLAVVLLLALALVMPALLAGGDDPDVSLTAAGQPPAADVPPAPPATLEEATTTTTLEDRLRVEAIHGRSSPPQPTGSSVPPADDPVGRPSTTRPSPNAGGPLASVPPAVTPPTTNPASAGCSASEVQVSVVTAPTYALGEPVRGSTTIENRSATTCLLPTRGFVRILNAAGKDVSSFAYTMEFRIPVSAEPGKTFTTPFTWDQRDCTGHACLQVPAGTYTVVADWTEGGPYSGRRSFQIGA